MYKRHKMNLFHYDTRMKIISGVHQIKVFSFWTVIFKISSFEILRMLCCWQLFREKKQQKICQKSFSGCLGRAEVYLAKQVPHKRAILEMHVIVCHMSETGYFFFRLEWPPYFSTTCTLLIQTKVYSPHFEKYQKSAFWSTSEKKNKTTESRQTINRSIICTESTHNHPMKPF